MAQSRRGAGVYNFKGPDGEVARAHPALTHALNNGGMRVAVVNDTSQRHAVGHGITLYKGDVVEVSPKSSCALSGTKLTAPSLSGRRSYRREHRLDARARD